MAIYDIFTLGAADNKITFNDETQTPYFRVSRRYPTKREIREFDIDLPESPGIADFESFIGKEYMILEGKMYPNQESDFYSGRETIRKLASMQFEQADAASDQGYVPLTWTENVSKTLMVKVQYVDMEENTALGLTQPFRLVCKVKYPVISATTPTSGTLTVGISSVTAGSSPLPFVLPVVLSGSAGTSSVSLTNTGDMPAYPSITITGPVNIPRLTNTTTGEYIELSVNLASSANSAIITYDQDSLSIFANGVNSYGTLTSGSTLFKVKSGANTFTLTGGSVGVGAAATIAFQSAYSLS